jgi:hypothetical protein
MQFRFDVMAFGCFVDGPEGQTMTVNFNNRMNSNTLIAANLEISPTLENLSLQPSGSHLTIRGDVQAKTSYKVKFSGKITDAFGEHLDESKSSPFFFFFFSHRLAPATLF